MKHIKNRGLLSRLLGTVGLAESFSPLEARQLFAAAIVDDIDDVSVNTNSAGTIIELANRFNDANLDGTIVKFQSVLGTFYGLLYSTATPITVTNFLRYADGNLYDNTVIHRTVSNFIIQGGGFGNAPTYAPVTAFPAIQNEPGISNVRGTFAMAKLGGNPNSATNQWFVNLADNSSNLNNQNGGFTVFGRVIGDGMTIVDAIAAVQTWDASSINGAFTDFPLRNFNNSGAPTTDNTVSFSDISRADKFSYSVTVGNPNLVSAQVIDGRLSLSYVANQSGNTTITVRATAVDSTTGTPNFVEDTFNVTVASAAPTITSVVAANATVGRGASIQLSATGVDDIDTSITGVQYYSDTDGNGAFDAAVDTLITTVAAPANGYRATFSASTFGLGNKVFFARVQDATGLFSTAVSTTVQIVSIPPEISRVSATPATVSITGTFTLAPSGLSDEDGTVTAVQYFADTDGNGVFDSATDQLIETSTNAQNGFRITVSAANYAIGSPRFFARAVDNFEALSEVVSTTVAISSFPPIIGGVRASVALLAGPGSPLSLSATSPRDTNGTVVAVQYFQDDGDGIFQADIDTLLGTSNVPSKFTFNVNTAEFVPAVYTFFARAQDNTELFSAAVSTTVRINAVPTIEALTPSSQSVERVSTFDLTASGVNDDNAVRSVEFWRDVDGNGELDVNIDKRAATGKRDAATGNWSGRVATKGFGLGEITFFAVAVDSNRGRSVGTETVVVLTNALPTLAGVAPKPTVIANLGENVTLTGRTPKDRDGTIAAIQYFHDDGDGLFEVEEDTLLGESTARGFSLTTSTAEMNVGSNTIFARARDDAGGFSAPASTVFTINAPPVIENVITPDTTVVNGTPFTVAANGISDPDGTIKTVEFFIDANGDGEFQTTDRLLGRGRLSSTGTYSLTVTLRNQAPSTYEVFVRVTDNRKGVGSIASADVLVG